jgi:hypothetical protein
MGKKRSSNKLTAKQALEFIRAAKRVHEIEGTIEIDDPSENSALDAVSGMETVEEIKEAGGMYVKSWVWVAIDDLHEEAREVFEEED